MLAAGHDLVCAKNAVTQAKGYSSPASLAFQSSRPLFGTEHHLENIIYGQASPLGNSPGLRDGAVNTSNWLSTSTDQALVDCFRQPCAHELGHWGVQVYNLVLKS